MFKKKAQEKSAKPQAKSKKAQKVCKKPEAFSKTALENDILKEAKIIKIPVGEAKGFSGKVAEKVAKWVEKRGEVTASDVNAKVADEIKKYNKDLAFIYKNRGKII